MQARQERNTVERLDRPSAYYLGKVVQRSKICILANMQKNKKRRQDDRDGAQSPQQEPEDPLANATTLYVGNLYVKETGRRNQLMGTDHSTLRKNKFMSYLPSKLHEVIVPCGS